MSEGAFEQLSLWIDNDTHKKITSKRVDKLLVNIGCRQAFSQDLESGSPNFMRPHSIEPQALCS